MTGPSRGRKQCPDCKQYVGVRSTKCAQCGHQFTVCVSVPKVQKTFKTYDGPGRGRKLCSCGSYVHVKVGICPTCNTSFNKVRQEKKKATVVTQQFYNKGSDTKRCHKCKNYVPKSATTCPHCQFLFPVSVKPKQDPADVKLYEETGPGRKQCVHCKAIVSAKLSECICGSIFADQPKATNIGENDKWVDKHEDELIDIFGEAAKANGCKVVLTPSDDSPVKLYNKNTISYKIFCEAILEYGLEKKILYSPRAIKCFARQFLDANSKEYKEFTKFVDGWVVKKIDTFNEME